MGKGYASTTLPIIIELVLVLYIRRSMHTCTPSGKHRKPHLKRAMYSHAAQPSIYPYCHSNVRVKPHQSHPITSQTSSRSNTSNHYKHQARQTHQTHPKHQARRTHQTRKVSTTINHPKPSSAPDLIPAPVSVRAHVGLHCASGSTRYPRRLLSLLGRGVPLLRRHRCPSQKESKTGWNETLMTSVYSTQT